MDNKFKYTYSAPSKEEREEIEDIRKGYLPKEEREEKLETLKKLDKLVKNIPVIYSLSDGIIGVLVFGLGLTMVLEWNMLALGVIVSLLGAFIMSFAYLIYNLMKNKMMSKYKDEILSLSEELLNEHEKD